MNKNEIIKSIAERGNGDIYLGIVGAVRTGKSTFIKKIMENLVLPFMDDEYEKKRIIDELPQSAAGKQIMTTEPKFVPNNAVNINIDDYNVNVRLIDCVGFVVKNAIGYEDENGPRMVKTPWYDEAIPFVEAAQIGTEKVIKDHSSIGIVVTTDGSFGELSRSDYINAEKEVLEELRNINKPHIIVLNSIHPVLPETIKLAEKLHEEYNVPVIPMNVDIMSEKDVVAILREALYEFPVLDINVNIPEWIAILKPNNWLKKYFMDKIRESINGVDKLRDVDKITDCFKNLENIDKAYLSNIDTSTGEVTINLHAPDYLFDQILEESIGVTVENKAQLLQLFQDYNEAKIEYDQIKGALKQVKQSGYGIASPSLKDMRLDTPEIIKQGSRYGVKLKAVAPSIHMIRVDVESTFEPIIGSELQSKELINCLTKDTETNPENIWKSEIFGRSLDVIVKEGIQAKLSMMPDNIRYKLQTTLTKIINKGSNNMIAIVL